MELKAIGVIHSPYIEPDDAPIQGRPAEEILEIEVFPEYMDGMKGIDQVSHLIVLYWCDRVDRGILQSITPFSNDPKGVFACRAQMRPNPIAFCIAEVLERNENILRVKGIEALEGSPLLDLKPYSSAIDSIEGIRIGWMPADAFASRRKYRE